MKHRADWEKNPDVIYQNLNNRNVLKEAESMPLYSVLNRSMQFFAVLT